jgi:hypothetical protein
MNAMSSALVCDVQRSTPTHRAGRSAYASAQLLACYHDKSEQLEAEYNKSGREARLLKAANRQHHKREAMLRQVLITKPSTPADAISLIVASMAELGPLVDGCLPEENLPGYVAIPALAIERAVRLLAGYFGIPLASIGGDYCMIDREISQ